MSSYLPSNGIASLTKPIPPLKKRHFQTLQARAQSFRNEGNNIVDANMSVLREKIEEVKMKERLKRSFRREIGWNNYNDKLINKKDEGEEGMWHEVVELVGIVGGTIGIAIVSGTAFLCLFSLLVHFNS